MGNIQEIDAKTAKDIFNKEDAILIDVREPAEHRAEKLKIAHNMPLSKIKAEHISNLKADTQKVMFHCKSGKRSQEACEKIARDLPFDIYCIKDGFENLVSEGFENILSQSNLLPLDRQVQLVVSLMILSGLIIYYFVSPIGLILPLMAGLGLMNAALTGWCGMAKILAVMPWNQ
jgi:rhodanese-related sulfurtransferase